MSATVHRQASPALLWAFVQELVHDLLARLVRRLRPIQWRIAAAAERIRPAILHKLDRFRLDLCPRLVALEVFGLHHVPLLRVARMDVAVREGRIHRRQRQCRQRHGQQDGSAILLHECNAFQFG